MADITKAYKNWPAYDDDLANKVYVDSQVENLVNGDIEKLAKKVEKNTEDITTAERDIVNLNNTKLNTSVYDTFITEQYDPLVVKVDGKIESYYQDTDPSLNWVTGLEKNSHVGDIWYDTTTQKTLVYYKDTSTSPVTYFWQWQNVPIELIDSVNGKAKIYSGVIPTDYVAGDYWLIPLNCYTNTYSLTSQSGEFSVGMKINLGPYEFEVDSVNNDNEIVTYHMNVPNTSNYNLTETLSDTNIIVAITSTSSFTLPNNCYGGSICVATQNGTTYDSTKWLNRNDYIPQDKANNYALQTDVDNSINEVNANIDSTAININNTIRDNVNTLNNTIDNNYSDLSTVINTNKDNTDLDIANLGQEDVDIRTTYNGEVQRIDNDLIELEDRIVRNIRNTSGGNNLLRNSVGFRNRLYWNDEISGIIEQQYSTFAGKEITVNFRYKKTDYNQAKITLGYYENGIFVERYTILDTSEQVGVWSDVSYSYVSSVNNPVIRFNAKFDGVQDNDAENNGTSGSKLVFTNGLEITDLIIGYGSGKGWSPYFNELYGKTFNLDMYGFDIRESASDRSMHLDTNSLDFKDIYGNIESVFSKAETRTDVVNVNNSINIGNLNIVKLDDNNIIEY